MRLKTFRQNKAAERDSRWRASQPGISLPAAMCQVSVIVAARNYARFLSETLESVCRQSVPCEVIYSDDCSSDDSVAIATEFAQRFGIWILPAQVQRGVCAARNSGACHSTGKYLVFVDGDDVLPPDFVEKHLTAIEAEANTPFVYGPARVIGEGDLVGHIYPVPEWSDYDRWKRNTVNTSSMYARWAFAAAGGWREDALTMWDWDLALRAARFGTPQPSTATLDYRYHGESWSESLNERHDPSSMMPWVRRLNARLSVAVIYSGRVPGILAEWASRVAASVKWARLIEPAELIVLDHSRDADISRRLEAELRRYSEVFDLIRIVPYGATYEWSSEMERRDRVTEFMADASNRLLSLITGDVVWWVEDDILVPRPACTRLLDLLTAGIHPPEAVSGLYRDRHGTRRCIAGYWPAATSPIEFNQAPSGCEPLSIQVAGKGCLMHWKARPLIPRGFTSHVQGIAAHDWAWCRALTEAGGQLLLAPDVRCGHAITDTEVIQV